MTSSHTSYEHDIFGRVAIHFEGLTSSSQKPPRLAAPSFKCRLLALNVVCCETAIRLESGAQRTSPARTQIVADDPERTGETLGQWGDHRSAELTSSFTKDWTASATRVGNSS